MAVKPKRFKKKATKKIETVKVVKPKRYKSKNWGSSQKIETQYNFFPLKVKTKLQFNEDFAINTSVVSDAVNVAATTYSYRLTSLYDPRYETGGGTPLTWSILSTLYDVFKVYKCFVKVKFYNPTQDGMKCGVRVKPLGDSATLALPMKDLEENTDTCRTKIINDTGSQVVTFSSWIYPWQILGLPKTQYMGDALYGHASAGNPSNYPLLDLYACTTSTNAVIRCTVNIDYYAICSDRNLPA